MIRRLALAFALALLSAAALAGMSISPGTPAHTHADANTGGATLDPTAVHMAGTLDSTKPCASGYIRVLPNYCAIDGGPPTAVATLTAFVGCTQTTALAGVTDAKAVYFQLQHSMKSANSIGIRLVSGNFYDALDNTCSLGTVLPFTSRVYEWNATAATNIGTADDYVIVRTDANGRANYTYSAPSTGSQTVIYVLGYFD